MTLKEIRKRSLANAKERLELVNEMSTRCVKGSKFAARVDLVDWTFCRKIRKYKGDITTHRIANLLKQLGY